MCKCKTFTTGKNKSAISDTYYSTTTPCYHTRASDHTQYATVLHCRSEQKYERKAQEQNGHTELSN